MASKTLMKRFLSLSLRRFDARVRALTFFAVLAFLVANRAVAVSCPIHACTSMVPSHDEAVASCASGYSSAHCENDNRFALLFSSQAIFSQDIYIPYFVAKLRPTTRASPWVPCGAEKSPRRPEGAAQLPAIPNVV